MAPQPAPVIPAFAPPPAELGQAGRQIERELAAPRRGPRPLSDEPTPYQPGRVELRVLADLTEAKRDETLHGAIALAMARQLDQNKGLAGLATAVSALLITMEQAMSGAGPKDQLDQLRERRDRKLG